MRDVEQDYVSLDRARKDYGVVLSIIDIDLAKYTVDISATTEARQEIAAKRREWIQGDPEDVAKRYRNGEICELDMVRRYGVIVDWGTGELMPKSTKQFRDSFIKRTAAYWNDDIINS